MARPATRSNVNGGTEGKHDACAHEYDSGHIPADEYAQIRRIQMRFRTVPIALGLTVAALAIVFTLTGNIVGGFSCSRVAPPLTFDGVAGRHDAAKLNCPNIGADDQSR